MHIDSYQFGNVVIDGVSYDSDILIAGDEIRSNWWRKEGHQLYLSDIIGILETKPAVLVIGTGAMGKMNVEQSLIDELQSKGIKAEVYQTDKAVKVFNELKEKEVDLCAAFHLTC